VQTLRKLQRCQDYALTGTFIKTRQTNIECTRKAKYAIVVLQIIQKLSEVWFFFTRDLNFLTLCVAKVFSGLSNLQSGEKDLFVWLSLSSLACVPLFGPLASQLGFTKLTHSLLFICSYRYYDVQSFSIKLHWAELCCWRCM